MMSDNVIIHLWCCPRTLSTATMYSFAQRSDCKVLDEPLYASYLVQNPDLYRPYRDELLSDKKNCDGNYVLESLPDLFSDTIKVIVCKHITKQLQGVDLNILFKSNVSYTVHHIFLIRDPLDSILSWNDRQEVHKEGCNLHNLCFPQMVHLYSEIQLKTNTKPIVIDSNILKMHSKEVLLIVCQRVGIPFIEQQLSWPAGPKPDIDGMWASHWYKQVHQSTGYNKSSKADSADSDAADIYGHPIKPLNSDSLEVYRSSLPLFELLHRHAIGVDKEFCPHSSCPNLNMKDNLTSIFNNNKTSSVDIDIRNRDVLVWIGDKLYPRELARVSAFDSSVQGGDAVWEGLRIYKNKIFKLDKHLERLFDSAKALSFKNIPSVAFIQKAIVKTLQINGMFDNVHVRLTLTRGVKITSSMNPIFNMFGTTLIVLPEWKPVVGPATYDNDKGVSLITAAGRRHPADTLDSKIHHCNLLNNILPKIQANNAGAADAVMLDKDGYVAETNATNLFLVKDRVLYTPTADVCLPGITRQTVINLARTIGITVIEKSLSLVDFYVADEVFTTGTMGELTKVVFIDGRVIGGNCVRSGANSSNDESMLKQLSREYQKLTETEGFVIPNSSSDIVDEK